MTGEEKKEQFFIGTIGKEELEVWIEGEMLEKYKKMNREERDKFTDEILHTFYYKFHEEGVIK